MRLPERIRQATDANVFAGTRRFDKAAITEVDAHMIGLISGMNSKKEQIATPEAAIRYPSRLGIVVHLVGGSRQLCRQQRVKGIIDQPAAVKPLFRRFSSPDIGLAKLCLQALYYPLGNGVQPVIS